MCRCIRAALPPFWFADNATSSCSGNYWKLQINGDLSKKSTHFILYKYLVCCSFFSVKSPRFGQSESGKVKRPPGVKLAVIFVIWSIKLHWTTKVPPRCHGWAGRRLKLTQRCGRGGTQHGSGSPLITAAESVTKKADSYLQRQPVYRGRDGSLEEGGSAPPNQQRPFAGVVFLFPLMGS